jgi:sulfoxide reductase heme-binding subunit YedZ
LLPIAISSHLFWITCRASGIAALVLVSASVGVGVCLSGRLVKGSGPDLRVAHETLSLAAYAMIALHVLSLLGDSYFHPTIADVAIPFERDYREPYMAIGIIGGWGTIVLGLSYYVREFVGTARWRVLHRFTLLTWVLSVIHTLGEGSDSGEAWFIALVVVTVLPTAVLILGRLGSSRQPQSAPVEWLTRSLPRLRGSGP